MIPTYNEKENLPLLLPALFEAAPEIHVVVVDDDSPDGTAAVAREMQARFPHLHLLVRHRQRGRGTAGLAGFRHALSLGADLVVEMDADFSHHPRYLPVLIREAATSDVVLGSRFVPGGEDRRGLGRKAVTWIANRYIRLVLGLALKDCTSGYRCFRREVLEGIQIDQTVSLGPSIVQELLYKACLKGFRVSEVPIVFEDRVRGEATFNAKVMLQSFLMVLMIRYLFSNLRAQEFHRAEGGGPPETSVYPGVPA